MVRVEAYFLQMVCLIHSYNSPCLIGLFLAI
nr:MAG TPA_asm: hypothetical protein [Caudoviricetes sp.]DAP17215.1 MAG TPA: hypothetical protein [Caudoviricetes sp.]DAT90168.1 MAG TPA: hypothetical protein [Caudoviricetes sp.]